MATGPNGDGGKARYGDAEITRGRGGETRQTTADGAARLTTAQGVPVSDDQNTLRAGEFVARPYPTCDAGHISLCLDALARAYRLRQSFQNPRRWLK